MSSTQDPGHLQPPAPPAPSPIRYILGFLIVGMAWGLTTPFMRKAAISYSPPERNITGSWVKMKIVGVCWAVVDLLRRPAYAVPLVLNLTGSVWFFLLVGKAELSLTVPITNSLAFLFTVLGEWYVDRKAISRDTWIGMILVLTGIALCVQSKL
ncbi:integral membrane protein [Aulographum hederae CBS 113979]|uniref:Integral membrane protein n=1 Tax=Aulographum hederae CBS 113979 TaxID=1176131 RepID=A0A6G1H9V8_9PEZI|nr:integral membrane protein [Aulographum hederae CBS 113979]